MEGTYGKDGGRTKTTGEPAEHRAMHGNPRKHYKRWGQPNLERGGEKRHKGPANTNTGSSGADQRETECSSKPLMEEGIVRQGMHRKGVDTKATVLVVVPKQPQGLNEYDQLELSGVGVFLLGSSSKRLNKGIPTSHHFLNGDEAVEGLL